LLCQTYQLQIEKPSFLAPSVFSETGIKLSIFISTADKGFLWKLAKSLAYFLYPAQNSAVRFLLIPPSIIVFRPAQAHLVSYFSAHAIHPLIAFLSLYTLSVLFRKHKKRQGANLFRRLLPPAAI
jgi:hypothetical protein